MRGLLTYAIPPEWLDSLRPGHVVLVPLGKRGGETGYVIDRVASVDFDPAKVKRLTRVLDTTPAFDDHQLSFFKWIANYYLMPLGMVIQTALPSQFRARVVSVCEPTETGVDWLSKPDEESPARMVLREIVSRPGLTRRGLVRKLHGELDKKEVGSAVDQLVRRRYATWVERELKESKNRIRTVSLAVSHHEALELMPRAGRRMLAIVNALADHEGAMDVPQLVADQGQSVREALRRLEDRGLLTFSERELRDNLVDAPALGPTEALTLNEHQSTALAALTRPEAEGAFCLYGVTGSGKTEVFLGLQRMH